VSLCFFLDSYLGEVVAGHRTVGVLLVEYDAAIDPVERLRGLPLPEQGRDREAVLGGQLRLFA